MCQAVPILFFPLCPHKNCRQQVLLLLPFYSWNWASEWPILLLMCAGARVWLWAVCLHGLPLSHYALLSLPMQKERLRGKQPYFQAILHFMQGSLVSASICIFRRFYLDKSSNDSWSLVITYSPYYLKALTKRWSINCPSLEQYAQLWIENINSLL